MKNICDILYTTIVVCSYCSIILIGKLVGGLIGCLLILLIIESVSRERPAFYLDDLHVTTTNNLLNNSNSSTTTNDTTTITTMIHFNLTIENPNLLHGLYYKDPVTLTFTYFPPPVINKNANVTIARYTIQGFYQGFGKVKHVRDFVVVDQDMMFSVREPVAKVAALSLDLDGRVKFKTIERRKRHLLARAFVKVNCTTGHVITNNTYIPFYYTSGSDDWTFLQWLAFTFLFLLLFICLCPVACSVYDHSPRRQRY